MNTPEHSTDLQSQAEVAVRDAEKRARCFYGLVLPAAELDFSLRGRCAGQARLNRNGTTTLRFNQQLLAENCEDFLKNTIPHEVAHLIVNWQNRKRKSKPKPHGAEWQKVMRDCFGLAAQRCHNYQTTPARIVPRPFLYSCNCQEHLLTSTMHNKIHRSKAARCKRCKAFLRFESRIANPK